MLKRRQVIQTAIFATSFSVLRAFAKNSRKGIIIVYSKTGSTYRLAERIHEKTGFPLIRLELVKPYAENYAEMTDLAREEIHSDARREISTQIPDLNSYTDIYIGGPYWWGGLDVPMGTFLKDHPLEGKRVHPFITSGSSAPDGALKDIKRLCPKAEIEPYFCSPGSRAYSSLANLDKWIEQSLKD